MCGRWVLLNVWIVCIFLPGVVRADGGAVRVSEIRDDRRVTVFTAPTPLRVGQIDVSILVQNAESGKPLLDGPLLVRAWPSGQPDQMVIVSATTEAATNKLLRAASLDFTAPGSWRVEVFAKDAPPVGFDIDVGDALPAWLDMSAWIGWPAVIVAIFAVHQALWRRRRQP